MCEVGWTLKEAREAQGKTLSEMAERISVRKAILQALEECQYELLPEAALSRGYLKRYAQVLGLDPEPLLAQFPAKTGVRPASAPVERVVAPPRRNLPVWFLGALAGLALGLGFAIWRVMTAAPAPTTVEVPPATPPAAPERVALRVVTVPTGARVYLDGFLLGQAPVQAPGIEVGERILRVEAPGYKPYQTTLRLSGNQNLSVTLEAAPPPAATPAPPSTQNPTANPALPTPGQGIVVRLEGRSWIRVIGSNGQTLYEGIPAQGTQLTYNQPVSIRAGNPAAVRVSVNGQDQGVMGQAGRPTTRRYSTTP